MPVDKFKNMNYIRIIVQVHEQNRLGKEGKVVYSMDFGNMIT